MEQQIFNSIVSSFQKFLIAFISGGIICPIILRTKLGNKGLSIGKHLLYLIKNPGIIYSFYAKFYFEETLSSNIDLLDKIYNNEKLEELGIKRHGIKENKINLSYPGINYTIRFEENRFNERYELSVEIQETESNYKNLVTHIKKKFIKTFLNDVVIKAIQDSITADQYTSLFGITLRFLNPHDNFFIKGRMNIIPKGLIDEMAVKITDKDNDKIHISANLNKLQITVEESFMDFISTIDTYLSII